MKNLTQDAVRVELARILANRNSIALSAQLATVHRRFSAEGHPGDVLKETVKQKFLSGRADCDPIGCQ